MRLIFNRAPWPFVEFFYILVIVRMYYTGDERNFRTGAVYEVLEIRLLPLFNLLLRHSCLGIDFHCDLWLPFLSISFFVIPPQLVNMRD